MDEQEPTYLELLLDSVKSVLPDARHNVRNSLEYVNSLFNVLTVEGVADAVVFCQQVMRSDLMVIRLVHRYGIVSST